MTTIINDGVLVKSVSKERYITVGISLTPSLMEEIDEFRGDEGRSAFIRRAVRNLMNDGGEGR